MIKCAVFDMDGTLVDSMPMWHDITYDYARLKGFTAPEGLHNKMNRLSLEQCAEMYIQLGAQGDVQTVMDELSQLAYKGYCEKVEQKPHAAEFLKLLHENGIKTAVATASDKNGVAAALKKNGMLPYVDFLITCTEVGKGKQHPDIFLACAEHFNAQPNEAVVFEDSAYAVKTARTAGFSVVAVADNISINTTPGETAGDIAAVANRCITDFAELIGELSPPDEDNFASALHRATQG